MDNFVFSFTSRLFLFYPDFMFRINNITIIRYAFNNNAI